MTGLFIPQLLLRVKRVFQNCSLIQEILVKENYLNQPEIPDNLVFPLSIVQTQVSTVTYPPYQCRTALTAIHAHVYIYAAST